MLETPFEAGLGAFVRFDKGSFIGREALRARAELEPSGPARRLATLLIGGPDYVPVYGGEAVRLDGVVAGRLRSVAYGPTVARTIGTTYLPAALVDGTGLEVDVFGERIPAVVAADVLVDPTGARMRG
jgi:glycine cleavage system aminomethyltransferase T